MAKGQKHSVNALTVWMVLFVGLWLTSTVLVVIMYTGQEALKTENTRLKEANRRLISSSEQNSVALFQQASPRGPTVVGLLEQARADLAQLATGEPTDDTEAVRGKLNEFLNMVRSENKVADAPQYADLSCMETVQRLYKTCSSTLDQQQELEDRLAQLEGEVDRLSKINTEQQDQFDDRARKISDQLAQLEKEHKQYREKRDQQVAGIERDTEERRRQSDADLTEERQRTSSLQQRIALLVERSKDLQEQMAREIPGPVANATARLVDGEILTAMPGDRVVYINLGQKDRLVLGQKFAVYAVEKGIPADGRSKAQIEVVTIFPHSAECRILHVSSGQYIMQGDLIANPVYDRYRTVDFVVAGAFDLDHDGANDPNGSAAIEAMITNWGGTVAEKLSARTDFVVLGVAPRRPRKRQDATGEQAARLKAEQAAFAHYQETIKLANTLSIPILPQETFLNYLGYRTRLASR